MTIHNNNNNTNKLVNSYECYVEDILRTRKIEARSYIVRITSRFLGHLMNHAHISGHSATWNFDYIFGMSRTRMLEIVLNLSREVRG